MSSPSENVWSNNPNAPQIPYWVYMLEKTYLTGIFVGAIFYGISVTLFFQCMGALLNPVDRKTRGIKWGLVAYVTFLFLGSTVRGAISATNQSLSFIDNRAFPGNVLFSPGPIGYEALIAFQAAYVFSYVIIHLGPSLADGFLLYRCHVIYSKNYWVMVLPCLMYLAALALSIAAIYYQNVVWDPLAIASLAANFEISFYSISLSLNVLLTLMIGTRLILHRRNIRDAIGPAADSGLYNTVITMIVESFALYAVTSLLYLGPYGAGDFTQFVFYPIHLNAQVISPLLITLRVANRTALTSEAVSSGKIGSIRFRSRGESTAGNETLPGENLTSPMETNGEASGEPGAVVENIIEEVPI